MFIKGEHWTKRSDLLEYKPAHKNYWQRFLPAEGLGFSMAELQRLRAGGIVERGEGENSTWFRMQTRNQAREVVHV